VSLDLKHPSLARTLARTHPYLQTLCTAAGERALTVHADEVTVEHLLDACMRDEDCAAHELVVHAFADPETVSFELAALSPGMMVVGSIAALPFSTLAVEALRAARAASLEVRGDEVGCGLVLREAHARLPDPLGLEESGLGPKPGEGSLSPEGPLFRGFSTHAKQALSGANKAAHASKEPSISPAQLVLACLKADPALAQETGLSVTAARSRLTGTLDTTPPPPRSLPPSSELTDLLASLPDRAGSLELWAGVRASGCEELCTLLDRHKITSSLLERAGGAFADPDVC